MTFFKKQSFIVCAAVGVGCALVLTALLCVPVAWALTREVVPQTTGAILAAVSAGVSVLIPTAVIVRTRGRAALATGGAIGGTYLALAALLCALAGSRTAFGSWLICLATAVLLGGLAGAMVSIRQNTHRKRKR